MTIMAMFSRAFDLAVLISVVVPVKTKVCATFNFCIFLLLSGTLL